jgi:hypothetical protein
MPGFAKAAIDSWTAAAGITGGLVFRAMNNRHELTSNPLLAQNVMDAVINGAHSPSWRTLAMLRWNKSSSAWATPVSTPPRDTWVTEGRFGSRCATRRSEAWPSQPLSENVMPNPPGGHTSPGWTSRSLRAGVHHVRIWPGFGHRNSGGGDSAPADIARWQLITTDTWLIISPQNLEGKLKLPRSSGRRSQVPGRGDRRQSLREQLEARRGWRAEVGVIQRVESFEPELDVEGLRNSEHAEILKQRSVPVSETWTAPDVTSCVAQACRGTRSCKTRN